MCNASRHPPECACGFGPPYPYAYPHDEIPSDTIDFSSLPSLGGLPGPLPEFLVADLTLWAGREPIGYEVGVAGATIDPDNLPETTTVWTSQEHEAFDSEIAAMRKTINALRQRIEETERQGRDLGQNDMKWLNSVQMAGPTGYRSGHYRQSLCCIQDTIDIYESWWNPSHLRDLIKLLRAGLKFQGAGHVNRAMFEIEIARVTEYRELLIARKSRRAMKRFRVIFSQ